MFGSDKTYVSLVAKGPVIGLEFAGTNCITVCQQILNHLLTTTYQNTPRQSSRVVFCC